VKLNLPYQQAYVSVTNEGDTSAVEAGEFWLIYAPQGADPGSVQSDSFVEFSRMNITYNGTMTSYCSYTTRPDWPSGTLEPPGKFPGHWIVAGEIQLSNWFDFSSEIMEYTGTGVWRGINVDHWESESTCAIFGEDPLPCARLATPENDDTTPVANVMAYEKTPNSFESDWISFDWWNSFEAIAPQISLPFPAWTTTCYNHENGFLILPEHGFVVTPTETDNFTVALTARPVASLGPVTVTFKVGTKCVGCIAFQSAAGYTITSISFDDTNWNIPQLVFLKYLKDGETHFTLTATGGGYDIPHARSMKQTGPEIGTRSYSIRVQTCANGVAGWGCSKRRRR